jgi:hypothetical protein
MLLQGPWSTGHCKAARPGRARQGHRMYFIPRLPDGAGWPSVNHPSRAHGLQTTIVLPARRASGQLSAASRPAGSMAPHQELNGAQSMLNISQKLLIVAQCKAMLAYYGIVSNSL